MQVLVTFYILFSYGTAGLLLGRMVRHHSGKMSKLDIWLARLAESVRIACSSSMRRTCAACSEQMPTTKIVLRRTFH